jgi:hypothetical protein
LLTCEFKRGISPSLRSSVSFPNALILLHESFRRIVGDPSRSFPQGTENPGRKSNPLFWPSVGGGGFSDIGQHHLLGNRPLGALVITSFGNLQPNSPSRPAGPDPNLPGLYSRAKAAGVACLNLAFPCPRGPRIETVCSVSLIDARDQGIGHCVCTLLVVGAVSPLTEFYVLR